MPRGGPSAKRRTASPARRDEAACAAALHGARAALMSTEQADRRRGDRRKTDRRRPPPPSVLESWFGAAGLVGLDSASRESYFDPAWGTSDERAPDGGSPSREARRLAGAADGSLARVYRTYVAARAAVGVGLVALQVIVGLVAVRAPVIVVLVCLAYAVQAITLWLLPRYEPLAEPQQQRSMRRLQWMTTIGVDLLAFMTLHWFESGSSFNFAALLVLPVLMGGVMTSRLMALGTAAGVTLLLLAMSWAASLEAGEVTRQMLQSGLAGVGLFVITLLSGELAGRLAREEMAARGSLELARQQALLNRLVIEEMADGVLVVDRRQRVRAANPAARALLVAQGLARPSPFMLAEQSAWTSLAEAVSRALADGDWPEEGRDVTLSFDGGYTRTLRMRVRFMRGGQLADGTEASEQLAVLLLEDVRTAQARLRQEKLAAMGRVSAGIAHEIRNPLAAIAQANALLLEDELPPAQQRLARMVAENVERLKRLVDDVMEVAPGAEPVRRVIDGRSLVGAAAAEWASTVGLPLGTDSRLRVEMPAEPLGVVFDPEHLRRVLVNLLDNARRHASERPGSIFLRLAARDDATAQMSVLSDSDPIPPDVERYLFEPFFSTRSRGSGLGLYICRELCERYGASIEYRSRPGAERLRNDFLVTLQRGPLDTGEPPLPLDT